MSFTPKERTEYKRLNKERNFWKANANAKIKDTFAFLKVRAARRKMLVIIRKVKKLK